MTILHDAIDLISGKHFIVDDGSWAKVDQLPKYPLSAPNALDHNRLVVAQYIDNDGEITKAYILVTPATLKLAQYAASTSGLLDTDKIAMFTESGDGKTVSVSSLRKLNEATGEVVTLSDPITFDYANIDLYSSVLSESSDLTLTAASFTNVYVGKVFKLIVDNQGGTLRFQPASGTAKVLLQPTDSGSFILSFARLNTGDIHCIGWSKLDDVKIIMPDLTKPVIPDIADGDDTKLMTVNVVDNAGTLVKTLAYRSVVTMLTGFIADDYLAKSFDRRFEAASIVPDQSYFTTDHHRQLLHTEIESSDSTYQLVLTNGRVDDRAKAVSSAQLTATNLTRVQGSPFDPEQGSFRFNGNSSLVVSDFQQVYRKIVAAHDGLTKDYRIVFRNILRRNSTNWNTAQTLLELNNGSTGIIRCGFEGDNWTLFGDQVVGGVVSGLLPETFRQAEYSDAWMEVDLVLQQDQTQLTDYLGILYLDGIELGRTTLYTGTVSPSIPDFVTASTLTFGLGLYADLAYQSVRINTDYDGVPLVAAVSPTVTAKLIPSGVDVDAVVTKQPYQTAINRQTKLSGFNRLGDRVTFDLEQLEDYLKAQLTAGIVNSDDGKPAVFSITPATPALAETFQSSTWYNNNLWHTYDSTESATAFALSNYQDDPGSGSRGKVLLGNCNLHAAFAAPLVTPKIEFDFYLTEVATVSGAMVVRLGEDEAALEQVNPNDSEDWQRTYGNEVLELVISKDAIVYRNGSAETAYSSSLEVALATATWYRMVLQYNADTDQYQVYLTADGAETVLVGEVPLWQTQVPIRIVEFILGNQYGPATALDNVTIYERNGQPKITLQPGTSSESSGTLTTTLPANSITNIPLGAVSSYRSFMVNTIVVDTENRFVQRQLMLSNDNVAAYIGAMGTDVGIGISSPNPIPNFDTDTGFETVIIDGVQYLQVSVQPGGNCAIRYHVVSRL